MASPHVGNILSSGSLEDTSVLKDFSWDDKFQRRATILLGLLVFGLIAVYRDMFQVCVGDWKTDQYSHGWLIPIFTLVVLVIRRKAITEVPTMERWIGVGLLTAGLGVRIYSGMKYNATFDMLSFMVSLFGVFIMVGGFRIMRWTGWWLGFLFFMFPLPSVLEQKVLYKLKTVATIFSTYLLQTIGFAVSRSGNVITIEGTQVVVADVCSGMRMATILIAMVIAVVLLIDRPWWDKLTLLVSSLPIAIFVNVLRISVTAIVYNYTESESIRHAIHDWAGLAMPIIALGILFAEMAILERLSIPEDNSELMKMATPGRQMKASS